MEVEGMKCLKCGAKTWELYDNKGRILTRLCPVCDKTSIDMLVH